MQLRQVFHMEALEEMSVSPSGGVFLAEMSCGHHGSARMPVECRRHVNNTESQRFLSNLLALGSAFQNLCKLATIKARKFQMV